MYILFFLQPGIDRYVKNYTPMISKKKSGTTMPLFKKSYELRKIFITQTKEL